MMEDDDDGADDDDNDDVGDDDDEDDESSMERAVAIAIANAVARSSSDVVGALQNTLALGRVTF